MKKVMVSSTLLTLEGVAARRPQGNRQGSKKQVPKLCNLLIISMIVMILIMFMLKVIEAGKNLKDKHPSSVLLDENGKTETTLK